MQLTKAPEKVWSFLVWWLATDQEGDPRYYERWITWPNIITFFGMVSAVVRFALVAGYGLQCSIFTLWLTIFEGITDVVDGLVAKITGQKSRVGQKADPIRDNIITIVSIYQYGVVGGFGFFLYWQIIIMILAEISIWTLGCGRYIASHHTMGKIRRVIQIGIFSLLIVAEFPDFPWPFLFLQSAGSWFSANSNFTYSVLMIFSLVTLGCYLKSNWRIMPKRFHQAYAFVRSILV